MALDRFDRSRSLEDPRRILGVSEDAGIDEITRAFRRKVLVTHPDSGGPGSADADAFCRVVLAYKTLREELLGNSATVIQGKNAFKDPSRKISDGAYVFLDLSASEALRGGTMTVRLAEREELCPRCKGSGRIPDEISSPCRVCGGLGTRDVPWGNKHLRIVCKHCSGTGTQDRVPCPSCMGQGRITRSRMINVRIPPGIKDGDLITIPSQGPWNPARSSRDPLHAVARVDLPPGWRIEGADVRAPLDIDVWTALAGGCVTVQTVDGAVPFQFPSGTTSGDIHRLIGRGWVGENGTRGDHVAEISVKMPKEPPDELASSLVMILKAIWPAGGMPPALPGPKTGEK